MGLANTRDTNSNIMSSISPSNLRRFVSDVHIPCQPCARRGVQKSTYAVCDGCKEVMCELCFGGHMQSCTSHSSANVHFPSSSADEKVNNTRTKSSNAPTKLSKNQLQLTQENFGVSNKDHSNATLSQAGIDLEETASSTQKTHLSQKIVRVQESAPTRTKSSDTELNLQKGHPQPVTVKDIVSSSSPDQKGIPSTETPDIQVPNSPTKEKTREESNRKHEKEQLATPEPVTVTYPAKREKPPDRDVRQCKCHGSQVTEFYCQKHEALLCKTCVKLEHKICGVVEILDFVKQYDISEEYESVLFSMNVLKEKVLQILKVNNEVRQKTLKNKDQVFEQIKSFRAAIDQLLDKWEAKMAKEAEVMFQDIVMKQESLLSSSKKLTKTIESKLQDLEEMKQDTSLSDEMMFLHMKSTKSKLEEYRSLLYKVEVDSVLTTVEFHPNATLQKAFESSSRLGHMSSKHEPVLLTSAAQMGRKRGSLRKIQSMEKITYENITAVPEGRIHVKLSNDESACDIFGLAVINDDKIAAVDNSNLKVKIIDVNKEKIVYDIKLSSAPWDITLLPKDRLAVTLPGKKVVQILSCSGGLSKVNQLKVDGYCHGIDYCDEHLVVAMNTYPSKIQIMKLNGQVKKTILTDDSGSNLFMSCQDVAINKTTKDIYVSDTYSGSYCITKLNWEGKVTGVYKHSVRCETRGLVVLESGSIAVCYFDLNSILLVSPDLRSSRGILHMKDGLMHPRSLAISKEQDTLFVGSKGKDYLELFDMT